MPLCCKLHLALPYDSVSVNDKKINELFNLTGQSIKSIKLLEALIDDNADYVAHLFNTNFIF